jgi:hypothetical protein
LRERRSWPAESGDELVSEAGDWWVTEENRTQARGVASDAFARTYAVVEQLPRADGSEQVRARRIGTVAALPAAGGEFVHTVEGMVRAEAGEWIVVDEAGVSWPVPVGRFEAGYQRQVAPATSGP